MSDSAFLRDRPICINAPERRGDFQVKSYGRKLIPIMAIGILAVFGYVITNSHQAAAQGPPQHRKPTAAAR
jgi:hypothetical protein